MQEFISKELPESRIAWLEQNGQLLQEAANQAVIPQIVGFDGLRVRMQDLAQLGYFNITELSNEVRYSPELLQAFYNLVQKAEALKLVQRDFHMENIMYNGEAATFVDLEDIEPLKPGENEINAHKMAMLILDVYTEPFRMTFLQELAEGTEIEYNENADSLSDFMDELDFFQNIELYLDGELAVEFIKYQALIASGGSVTPYYLLKFARGPVMYILENYYPQIHAQIDRRVLSLVFDALEAEGEGFELDNFLI